MKIIKVEAIQGKLKTARKEKRIVYVTGSLGMGKTTAVKYFYRNIPHVYIDGYNGVLSGKPDAEEIGSKVLIIDSVSQITDVPSRKYILDRVYDRQDQVVLIGRGKIPQWLAEADVDCNFSVIGNKDLQFTDDNIRELYAAKHAIPPTDPDDWGEIVDRSWRNVLYIGYIIDYSGHEDEHLSHIISSAEHSMFQYMDLKFFNQFRREVREALIQLCSLGEFNSRLAGFVTANQNIRPILEEMIQVGNFLSTTDNQTFHIRRFYLHFLQWKQSVTLAQRQINEIHERAALYYELNGDMEQALYHYKLAEDHDRILHLLTRISEENPEMMNFTEIGPYFDDLPDEKLIREPALISGMSMMQSLRMNPMKSEEWYQKLTHYADMHMPGSIEEREARALLRFLDIKLPHRTTEKLEENLRDLHNYETYYSHGGYRKVSFTIGMPSALNGSLDFSDFMLGFRDEHRTIMELVEPIAHLLESDVRSTFRLVQAEWRFERDEMQGYEFNEILNAIYISAMGVGDMGLAFAAVAIMGKDFMAHGNIQTAMNLFDDFRVKTADLQDHHMKACIDAYYIRMMIRQGDISGTGDWLETSPNSNIFFTIRDRYLFIQKVRVLIMLQRYAEARSLIGRLELAFDYYHRPYLWIQTRTLKAILYYRNNNAEWQDLLIDAMAKAQEYGYIHILADEGAALNPLFEKLDLKKARAKGLSTDYITRVIEATGLMTVYYPQYLQVIEELEEPLTDMEHKVIRLMCYEMNSDEICDLLHISYSSLKFHKQNIYRKFGVKNRNEAQRRAKHLGLNLS